MNHLGHLGPKQRAVIKDILENGLDEYQALQKNNVKRWQYNKWLKNGLFKKELETRIDIAMSHAKLTLIRNLQQTAERLAVLTHSEKDDIARKACLDLLSIQKEIESEQKAEQLRQKQQPTRYQNLQPLEPELARRISAVAVAYRKECKEKEKEQSLSCTRPANIERRQINQTIRQNRQF